jgi:DNA-binding CsgD family transcriptional regulator
VRPEVRPQRETPVLPVPANHQPGRATARAVTVSAQHKAGGPALSGREREIAQLVILGRTYREISEEIFISPRTVEHHVARIRRRFGASSRSELLARLRMVLEPAPGGSTTAGDGSPAETPNGRGRNP